MHFHTIPAALFLIRFTNFFHAIFTSGYIVLVFYAYKWWYCRHWKTDGIYSLAFAVSEFSGLFLHPSICSIKHSRSAYKNGALADFWHWLNSNILVSSEGVIMLQKSSFPRISYKIHVCFLLQKNEGN